MICKNCAKVQDDSINLGDNGNKCYWCKKDLRDRRYFYCEDGREHFCTMTCGYLFAMADMRFLLKKVQV